VSLALVISLRGVGAAFSFTLEILKQGTSDNCIASLSLFMVGCFRLPKHPVWLNGRVSTGPHETTLGWNEGEIDGASSRGSLSSQSKWDFQ